ncbi:MAG: PKD domain-containing protein [Bacteroidetes bacterium]|nr:PKD domain-containing protein [Bacteroidota bacterium]
MSKLFSGRKALLMISLTVFFSAPALAQTFSADPLTGSATGSIPLWTIGSGDVSVPVSLAYYGHGVKVNDSQQSAGMGWALVAGGAVTREVRGLPDDLVGAMTGISGDTRNGWLHGSVASQAGAFVPGNYASCYTEVPDYNTLNGMINQDTEPDIYSFYAPGLGGQFVFSNNKVVQTVPYQDIKIQVTRESSDSLISQIVITNNQGYSYTFQTGDKTSRRVMTNFSGLTSTNYYSRLYGLYQSGATYYSSWYLTQVTSPSGGKVTFTYGNQSTTSNPVYLMVIDPSSNKIDSLYQDNYSVSTKFLQTVTGSNNVATIGWTGGLVTSVTVSDLTYGLLTKKFDLKYHNVWGSKRVASSKRVKRSFLSSVMEGLNCNAFPGYQFTYYGLNFTKDTTSMPFNSFLGQDLFGYYDSTATSGTPDIYYNNSVANGERYRFASTSGYSAMGGGSGGRTVNPAKVCYGSLKTVTLPSGGTSTYTYGAADYLDVVTSTTVLGGGARVASIKTSANDPGSDMTTTYKYITSGSSPTSSGQWTYRPMFVTFSIIGNAIRVPVNLAPEEIIYYSRVEVSTTGRGKTVYQYNNAGIYQTTSVSDFNASFSKTARSSCGSLGDLQSGYYTYPYAPNTNYDFERGLPTYVTDYNRAGKVVRRSIYTYQRTTLPKVPVSAVRVEPLAAMVQYSTYTLLSSVTKVSATVAVRTYDQGSQDTTSQYVEKRTFYTYNGNQMLSQVSTTNSDNSTMATTYKYAKDYPTNGVDSASKAINRLVAANRHGTLVESVGYQGSSVVSGSLTLFASFTPQNSSTRLVMPSQVLTLGDPTGFTASTVTTGNSFSYSSNYYPTGYVDAYDGVGHSTILRDQTRAIKSAIYGYNNSAVALDISNARYDQIAFCDFEPGNITVLGGTNGATVNSDSWSGQYSTSLASGNYVFENAISKGLGRYYRFSCWAKATASATLTIYINGTATSSTAQYPAAGKTAGTWQYIEATVDLGSILQGTSFSFQAMASSAIMVDNFAFYPQSASVVAHTYDPLNGKTADLDSRGTSAFVAYDALGRVRYLQNTDKDIVQIKDYHYLASNGVLPVSTFTGPNTPNMGASVTYTANPSCGSGVTYAWYVDGILQTATTSTFTYAFLLNKTYTITLVASATYGSSSTDMTVNPVPQLNASISVSGLPNGPNYCDSYPTITLSIAFGAGACYQSNNVTYNWYYSYSAPTFSGSGSILYTGPTYPLGTTQSVSFNAATSTGTYVYCHITSTCVNQTNGSNTPLDQIVYQAFSCVNRGGGQ